MGLTSPQLCTRHCGSGILAAWIYRAWIPGSESSSLCQCPLARPHRRRRQAPSPGHPCTHTAALPPASSSAASQNTARQVCTTWNACASIVALNHFTIEQACCTRYYVSTMSYQHGCNLSNSSARSVHSLPCSIIATWLQEYDKLWKHHRGPGHIVKLDRSTYRICWH